MAHLLHFITLFLLVLDTAEDKPCSFFDILKYTCHTVRSQFGNSVFERP